MNSTITLKSSTRLYVWVPVHDINGRHSFTIKTEDVIVQNATGVFLPVGRG
jgi:hypothetical protein